MSDSKASDVESNYGATQAGDAGISTSSSEEKASVVRRTVALVSVACHVYLIITALRIMAAMKPFATQRDPVEDELIRTGTIKTEWTKSSIERELFIAAVTLTPYLLYQTGRHWWHGTYFPCIAADEFYLLCHAREIDKRLPRISCGTVFAMSCLGSHLVALAWAQCRLTWVDIALYRKNWIGEPPHISKNEDLDTKLTALELLELLGSFLVVLKLPRLLLISVFDILAFSWFLLATLLSFGATFPWAWRSCGSDLDRKRRLGCIPPAYGGDLFYHIIAWFYVRL